MLASFGIALFGVSIIVGAIIFTPSDSYAIMTVFVGGGSLLIGLWQGIKSFFNLRGIGKLKNSQDMLAHWAYAPQELALFSENEWHFARRAAVRNSLGTLLVFFTFFLVFSFSFRNIDKRESWYIVFLKMTPYGMAAAAIVFGYCILVASLERIANRRGLNEVYIYPTGAIFNGRLYLWHYAQNVATEPGPPMILTLKWYQTQTGPGQVRIPVPFGREAEAERIKEFFSCKIQTFFDWEK